MRPVSSTQLAIDGDLQSRVLSSTDLEKLGAVDVDWKHNEEVHTYRAVPLEVVLQSVGFDRGPMGNTAPNQKRPGWKFVIVATANDGFQSVFSAAEISHGMGPTQAFVAFSEKGAPLADAVGPFWLVVPTDGEGSRNARNLSRLTIVDMRRVAPAQ